MTTEKLTGTNQRSGTIKAGRLSVPIMLVIKLLIDRVKTTVAATIDKMEAVATITFRPNKAIIAAIDAARPDHTKLNKAGKHTIKKLNL